MSEDIYKRDLGMLFSVCLSDKHHDKAFESEEMDFKEIPICPRIIGKQLHVTLDELLNGKKTEARKFDVLRVNSVITKKIIWTCSNLTIIDFVVNLYLNFYYSSYFEPHFNDYL